MLKLRELATKAYETKLTEGNYSYSAHIAMDFELGMDVVKETEELGRLLRSLIRI